MHTAYIVLEIIALFFSVGAISLLVTQEASTEQKFMMLFMFSVLVWNAGYLMELITDNPKEMLVTVKFAYLGAVWSMLSYARFMVSYLKERIPGVIFRIGSAVNVFVIIAVWTCEQHSLFYTKIESAVSSDGHVYFHMHYGPVFYLFQVVCVVIPYMLSVYTVFHSIKTKPNQRNVKQYMGLVIASVGPAIVQILYTIKVIKVHNPMPIMLSIVFSLVVYFVWKNGDYDIPRKAADKVLYSLEEGVVMLDRTFEVLDANPVARKVFGLDEKCVGVRFSYPGVDPEIMFSGDGKATFEKENRFYVTHVDAIRDEKRNSIFGYVLFIIDVSETRNHIAQLEDLRKKAEEATVVQGEFLANMSHEIRTPMNAIVGLSELIKEESKGRKVYDFACDIKVAARNLLGVVNDILDMSQVERGNIKMVETDYYPKSMTDEIIRMMRVTASLKGLQIHESYNGDIPYKLRGDEGRIKQIVINIMNNAVKFTKFGHVRLDVYSELLEENKVKLFFRIADTGVGMKEEYLEKIFDKFTQIDSKKNREAEGNGLGLAISKKIAELMGGTITVESTLGKGSTFEVSIVQDILDARSFAEVNENEEDEDDEVICKFTLQDYRILVVDDNMINRKVALGVLKQYGCELEEAESGMKAIELVSEKHYDMIFMDHMMPEMDGVETTKRIRLECGENGKQAIIVVLTANVVDDSGEMFLQNGFQAYMPKPIDQLTLNRLLMKWVPEERRNANTEENVPKETEETITDFEVEGIDLQKALERHSGGMEAFLEILNLYYLDGLKKMIYLEQIYEKMDIKTFEIEVHGLKSASANVGAMELSQMCYNLEMAAKNNGKDDLIFIEVNFPIMLAAYEKLLDEIKEALSKEQHAEQENAGDEQAISKEELTSKLQVALEHLESFRSKECAQCVREILGYRLEQRVRDGISEILNELKMYEDDKAEEHLKHAIEYIQ